MGILLEAKSLKKTQYRFKDLKWEKSVSVKDVSIYVNEGERVGILGSNGAGKSTSLKMITGDIMPDEGRVVFDGQDITTWPMYKRCNAGLGYMAQENTLFKQMTVENNLIGIMQMQGFTKKESRERCEELMQQFDLDRIRNNLAANISGGEKRRLEVARALTKRPKMLILDEPFAGVDPKVTQSVIKLVYELWEKWGIAILVTDHDFSNIMRMVQRVYLIHKGEVIINGTPRELVRDPVARECYFGQNTVLPPDILEFGNESSDVKETLPKEQSVVGSDGRQSMPQKDFIAEDADQPEQTGLTKDSELSELLQPIQTNDFQSDVVDDQPSPTLSDFIPQPESQTEETTDPTSNQQRQRKMPLSGPSIKPFRRKK